MVAMRVAFAPKFVLARCRCPSLLSHCRQSHFQRPRVALMRSTQHQRARPPVDEIIDDSEPEREEQRIKERQSRKKIENPDTQHRTNTSLPPKALAKGKPRSPQRTSRIVIEISGKTPSY